MFISCSLASVPVYLEGNIIDLGVFKLQVAEACSGLRYLFPILSFSYIFAVLYRGPIWHKAILLVSAVPITVFMNSVRIAVAGMIVNTFGLSWLEGFTHFFEGWVIFILCVAILFGLAWVMVKLRRDNIGLIEALDLETDGLWTQAKRVQLIEPSKALIFSAMLLVFMVTAWQTLPNRVDYVVEREQFSRFPTSLGEWKVGSHRALDPSIEAVLGADDYLSVDLLKEGSPAPVSLFSAWYASQDEEGVHSPEVCLPAAGWEIAQIDSKEMTEYGDKFTLNRVIIQKGTSRMLVYFWYDQLGVRTGSIYQAKLQLLLGKLLSRRNDGAIVRLTTQILPDETADIAEERLKSSLEQLLGPLPRFVPNGN